MTASWITKTAKHLLEVLPPHVTLVAAAKTRTPEEIVSAIRGGVTDIGHNYVQEAERIIRAVGQDVRWHLIGHLQRNKAKKAAELFDMVETVDSWRIARTLDRYCAELGKVMSVLIEVNSGREPQKTGLLPEEVDDLARRLGELHHIRLEGLMTMGPRFGDPQAARPYFQVTKEAFTRLKKADIPNVNMRYLSMGMSNTYEIAIEEGANMVRIGTKLFGERCNNA